MNQYLTKSKFKTGHECPTKLYYLNNTKYANHKIDDSFLAALAEGGYQVGELAKCYYPGGHAITTLDHQKALDETNKLLAIDNVIIYEAAVKYNDLFIRIDILIKEGNCFKLIEVKSKSFDPTENNVFWQKKGKLLVSTWRPYLFDVAFQAHVLSKSFPDTNIECFLMLCNKSKRATVDGLNQQFRVMRNGRDIDILKGGSWDLKDLGNKLLSTINVDKEVSHIWDSKESYSIECHSFEDYVNTLSIIYTTNQFIDSKPASKCKHCEHYTTEEESENGLKSGIQRCFEKAFSIKPEKFKEALILELWDCRNTDELFLQNKVFLKDLDEKDLKVEYIENSLSRTHRQYLQVQYAKNSRSDHFYINTSAVKAELDSWTYPLHFIDFETSMVSIPFLKGQKPYEGIAFQFSHHQVDRDVDGNITISHKGEFLLDAPGVFPNFEFTRALMLELNNDNGSIFKYSAHENTFLKHIYRQLDDSNELDKEELQDFIRSITHTSTEEQEDWLGERDMIDMLALVKKYYYHPSMKGSNSIKEVLPSLLLASEHIRDKYSNPIYGANTSNGIPSKNFKDWTWLKKDSEGTVIDPYKQLPKLYDEYEDERLEKYFDMEGIQNGGAAMTAYAKLQFYKMSDKERDEIRKSLLRYCELDTLAMVMIYEAWKEMVNLKKEK